MKKKRDIIINVIKNNKISNRRLAEFFAKTYIEKKENALKEKS